MYKILLLVFSFSLCSAQTPRNDIDSLNEKVKILETEQKGVKKYLDSLNSKFLSDNFISVKSTKEIQELHNTAYNEMQNSVSNFLTIIGIINGFLAVFIGFLVWVNFKSVENSKEELKTQKEEFYKTNANLQELKENFIITRNELFKYIANAYFEFSEQYYLNGNMYSHFLTLSLYYSIFVKNKIEPNESELTSFDTLEVFMKNYNENHLNDATVFLLSLAKFIFYCKDINQQKHYEKAKNFLEKLYERFGGKEKVSEALDNFSKNFGKKI